MRVEFADIFGTAIGRGSKTHRFRNMPLSSPLQSNGPRVRRRGYGPKNTRTDLNPIPWVLELTFEYYKAQHQLFVAYCVHGQKFVGFHIHTFENIWSGWHGAWQHNGDILDVELYYQEKISLFKFHRAGQCYNLVHGGEAISVTAHITMLPMLQNQIADISYHLP